MSQQALKPPDRQLRVEGEARADQEAAQQGGRQRRLAGRRGRGLAYYLVVFQGAQALGAVIWGAVADRTSVTFALLIAAAVLVAGALAGLRSPLPDTANLDRTTSAHWPAPQLTFTPDATDGPILVTVTESAAGEPSTAIPMMLRFLTTIASISSSGSRHRTDRPCLIEAAGRPPPGVLAWRGSATQAFGGVGSSVFRDLAAALTSQIGVVCRKRLEAEE